LQKATFTLGDRFRAVCPADKSFIRKFDQTLIPTNDGGDNASWVAVFRSTNNLPSVLVKDDVLNAMRIAMTTPTENSLMRSTISLDAYSPCSNIENSARVVNPMYGFNNDGTSTGVDVPTPVAVARLVPSSDFPDQWIIDTLRCSLKKEDLSDACDGGSEHAEALSVCIDELILHYLKQRRQKDGTNRTFSIRTKATIFSNRLLEDRGFQEVTFLSRDMATHVSSLENCMEKYAARVVSTVAKNAGARDRALQILSLLGQLDRNIEDRRRGTDSNETEGDPDPWASIKKFF